MKLTEQFVAEGINHLAQQLEFETERRRDRRRNIKAEALARLASAVADVDAERALDGLPPVNLQALKTAATVRMKRVARQRGLWS